MGFYTRGDEAGEYTGDKESADGSLIAEVEPGIFETLPSGYDLKVFDPQHPTTAFEAFFKAALQGVASGLNVPYVSLASDLEGVSYSSIRQGEIEARDNFRIIQKWLTELMHDSVFETFLDMAMLTGQINLPFAKFDKFNSPVWQFRGYHWVDPLKDVRAHIEAKKHNISTDDKILSEQGLQVEDIYQQLAEEKRMREQYGIKDVADEEVIYEEERD